MKKLSMLFFMALGFWSCEKDEIKAVLDENAGVTSVQLSKPELVLTKDEEDNDVLTITWEAPVYGFDAAPSYMVLIDKEGGNFSKAYATSTGKELKKVFKGSELNALLLNFELLPEQVHTLQVMVKAVLSNAFSLNSPVASLKATPYSAVLDLSSPWGVVGSAFNDWGATPDGAFYKTSENEVYVAYLTLKEGAMKFRKDSDWAVNYGGSDGKLEAGGADINVKAGTYKITMDLGKMTYAIEPYTWGVVGSAINDWGATPDGKLTYDPFSDQWRGIFTLKEGEMKVRFNNDWAVNYGDTGADGKLEDGGDNIQVKAGTYLVTVNFKDKSYSVVPVTNRWGIVGDASPNGWDGPDVAFDLDYSKFDKNFNTVGVWVAKSVVLKTGEIKFRSNNAWTTNYGDNGADGTLELEGANIKVVAGTYDVTLDFSGGTPTYTLIKK
jgi:hypothetical protein